MQQSAMRHFRKINLANTVQDGFGNNITFTPVAEGNGVIALDETQEAVRIALLDTMAEDRVGGIVRISKEQYDAQLKKKVLSRLQPQFGLRASPSSVPSHNKIASAAAAGQANGGKTDLKLAPELPPNFNSFRARVRKLKPEERVGVK